MLFASDIVFRPFDERTDSSERKRVELHLHTKMSTMDALTDVKAVFQAARRFGHKAVAITDHGVVQAFPEAAKANLNVEFLPPPADTIDKTSAQYNAFFDNLMVQDLDCDNIVLDSASELASTLLIQRTDVNKNGGAPTMKNYNEVQSSMRRYMRIMRDLAILKGKNVLILALESEMVLSQTGETTTRKAHPSLSGKKLAPEIEGLFDIVGHLEKMSDGRRFIRLEGTETFVAKDRFGRKGCFADGAIFLSGKTGNEKNDNTKEK